MFACVRYASVCESASDCVRAFSVVSRAKYIVCNSIHSFSLCLPIAESTLVSIPPALAQRKSICLQKRLEYWGSCVPCGIVWMVFHSRRWKWARFGGHDHRATLFTSGILEFQCWYQFYSLLSTVFCFYHVRRSRLVSCVCLWRRVTFDSLHYGVREKRGVLQQFRWILISFLNRKKTT